MIHHGCAYETGDSIVNKLSGDSRKETMAMMGYDGRYRCAECKRRVEMDVSDETYASDIEMLPKLEPPYPEGWCK